MAVDKERVARTFARLLEMVCLVCAAVSVAAPNGYCARNIPDFNFDEDPVLNQHHRVKRRGGAHRRHGHGDSTSCPLYYISSMSIHRWGAETQYPELKVQYFVFFAIVIFSLISFGLLFLTCAGRELTARKIVAICGLGAFIILTAGVTEAALAAPGRMISLGRDLPPQNAHILSWIAGSIFCFMTTGLYVAEILLALDIIQFQT